MSAAKLFIFALALASTQAFSLRVKGGLISEKISCWLQSPKKCAKHCYVHLLFRQIELRIVIWAHFLGDRSQGEKLYEINPPLKTSKVPMLHLAWMVLMPGFPTLS
jgi:hypothetical protein